MTPAPAPTPAPAVDEGRTPPAMVDALARRILPRVIVAASQVTWPARLGAAARRRCGRRGRVELFFAFDDPCSAVAVLDLVDRVAGRDVLLLLKPVVARGIPDDPAVDLKRRHAITDAGRLARREGRRLCRTEPLAAQDVAYLASWAASAPPGPAVTRFCAQALTRLWFTEDLTLDVAVFAELWRQELGCEPPSASGAQPALTADERLMRRRGPYDTPAAWVHGQWFFAQDRAAQIADRLDALGWTRTEGGR